MKSGGLIYSIPDGPLEPCQECLLSAESEVIPDLLWVWPPNQKRKGESNNTELGRTGNICRNESRGRFFSIRLYPPIHIFWLMGSVGQRGRGGWGNLVLVISPSSPRKPLL